MKTTKVYHAPGYPLDPAKEEKRMVENMCKLVPAKPFPLSAQTVDFTFGSHEEADAFLLHRARALGLYYEQKKSQ